MAIDVWAQITTERMAGAPWLKTLLRWTGRTDASFLPTPQSTVAAMDAGGVGIAFLSAWYGPEGPLISNEEVAAQIDTAPDRFRGHLGLHGQQASASIRGLYEGFGRKPRHVWHQLAHDRAREIS